MICVIVDHPNDTETVSVIVIVVEVEYFEGSYDCQVVVL